jgi:hypothetical protein
MSNLISHLLKMNSMKNLLIIAALVITGSLNAQIGNVGGLKKNIPTAETAQEKPEQKSTDEAQPTVISPTAAAVTENAKTLYVSFANGSNRNDGSQSAPFKNIDKAINVAEPGTVIKIAGGSYMGTLNVGFIESNKAVQMFGSFDENFTKQDIVNHPTLIQPDNASARTSRKALLKFTKDVSGTIIDHVVFDSGERNAYNPNDGVVDGVEGGRLMLPTEKPANMNSTVGEPLLQFVSATTGGDVTIQNCVFLNGASFALQAGHRSGKFTVKNNVFVGNKMGAVEIYGTCASTGGPNTLSNCGEVEIAYNTILFTWSRLKDFLDMGYGVRIMTKCEYNIHHNIIGASILAGIDHTRFNKDEWIKVDHNIFFVNKDKDFHYSPASNTRIRIDAGDFEDLEIASVTGNKNEIPSSLKVNKAYLEGYLSARYSETVDYDPNSPANQWRAAMGMNKQGTISSSATMFANKYPWKDALNLFGNVNGFGAQKP